MYPLNLLNEIHSENEELVFVVMPFADEYLPIYTKLIKPSVKNVSKELSINLRAERNDEKQYTYEGWTEILKNIFSARLIIGVMTDYNPNVFYELGIAHATRPLTKQILISESGFKQCFDTKDIIQMQFPRFEPEKSVQTLSKKISSCLKKSEEDLELSVRIAEASIGALELNLIENLFVNKKKSHFAINKGQFHDFFSITNLCKSKVLRLSTRVLDSGNLEHSWYWTPLGIRLLKKWNKIDKSTADEWILEYRGYFGRV